MKQSWRLAVTKGDENTRYNPIPTPALPLKGRELNGKETHIAHPHPRIKYGAGSNPPLEGEGVGRRAQPCSSPFKGEVRRGMGCKSARRKHFDQ